MANTVYTAAQAAARARAYSTYKVGYCLNFVWHCIDYPKVAGLASANAAWSAARQKVTSGTPPAGAPVYWSGGSTGTSLSASAAATAAPPTTRPRAGSAPCPSRP